MSRAILALCRQPPYGNTLAREGLEAILAAAAMNQSPQLLFLNDGVFQLLNGQNTQAIEQKNHGHNLQALPIFDIGSIYACPRSLEARNLSFEQIQLPGVKIEWVDNIGHFIAGFDTVLSF